MAISKIGSDALAAGAPSRSQLPAGTVLQVVHGTTTSATQTTSTSYVSTSLSATITPTSSTSKILVIADGSINASQANYGIITTIFRNSTDMLPGTDGFGDVYASNSPLIAPHSMNYLDSPATTSATTYTVKIKAESASYFVRYPAYGNITASMLLLEIAA